LSFFVSLLFSTNKPWTLSHKLLEVQKPSVHCHMIKSIKPKQWPLDSKFIEFEYLPEIRHFWQIRVLAKMTLFENGSDSLNSSTFANLVCSDSPDFFCKLLEVQKSSVHCHIFKMIKPAKIIGLPLLFYYLFLFLSICLFSLSNKRS